VNLFPALSFLDLEYEETTILPNAG